MNCGCVLHRYINRSWLAWSSNIAGIRRSSTENLRALKATDTRLQRSREARMQVEEDHRKVLQESEVANNKLQEDQGPLLVGCPRLLIQYIPYLQAVPPSSTWGRAMPWWQGPTYHGFHSTLVLCSCTIRIWLVNLFFISVENNKYRGGIRDVAEVSLNGYDLIRILGHCWEGGFDTCITTPVYYQSTLLLSKWGIFVLCNELCGWRGPQAATGQAT